LPEQGVLRPQAKHVAAESAVEIPPGNLAGYHTLVDDDNPGVAHLRQREEMTGFHVDDRRQWQPVKLLRVEAEADRVEARLPAPSG